jgi:hypothetical protein
VPFLEGGADIFIVITHFQLPFSSHIFYVK